MVRQEQHHRHHAAVAVQEAGARLDVVLGLHELALVPRQIPPLQAALAPSRAHDLGDSRERHDVAHALHVRHVPGEPVDRVDDAVVDAAVGLGLDDDVDDVGADREAAADEVAVAVVARVCAQLRHSRLRVADRRLEALDRAQHAEHHRDRDDHCRRAPVRDPGESRPDILQRHLAPLDAIAEAPRDRHERHEHRKEDQVGQDDHADAEARGHGHFTDDLHGDQQDRDEPDQVREERHDRRQEQEPERAARRLVAVRPAHRRVAHGTDLLHAVARADGEDDERHQDAERVHSVTEQHEKPEHPDHRDQRGDDRHQCDPERLDVDPDEKERERYRDDRERDDRERAVRDVAHDLGEADHVHGNGRLDTHFHLVALDARADLLLEFLRDRDVVDGRAGLRVCVEQLCADHRP